MGRDNNLNTVYKPNLHEIRVSPIRLFNKLKQLKLLSTCSRCLRIFNTTAVTVAQTARAFCSRFRIKDVLRSTVAQNWLADWLQSVEAELAKKNRDFSEFPDLSARSEARRAPVK